jgi:DNA invertase Pin-like site-specific DNA recombinase
MGPAIAYIRVSTAKQGRSGLVLRQSKRLWRGLQTRKGLNSPRRSLRHGKHDENHRPALAAALDLARRQKVPIIVAKLDRLSRDVHYISGLISTASRSSWLNSGLIPTRSCCICTLPWPRKNGH